MLTTAVIAFREFLEAFLIVGVFLGISRKLNLKKEFEIGLATLIGIVFSLLLATATYLFGNQVHGILTEKNAELLESYLMIFSGLFIAYVVFSLHDVINRSRTGTLIKVQQKLQERVFDFSLFS
ncbi:MAG: FTR1 family protein, partial [Patescibacteria group bacterium]